MKIPLFLGEINKYKKWIWLLRLAMGSLPNASETDSKLATALCHTPSPITCTQSCFKNKGLPAGNPFTS